MATVTLLTAAREIARRLGAYETGTATGGSTSTVVSAAYPFLSDASNASTKKYVNCTVRAIVNSDANGEERGVYTYTPSSGTLTVSNVFSEIVVNTDTFDIFKKGITFADIKAAINRALRRLKFQTVAPVTLITDGDMETSGTSSWTDTDTTHTKITSGFVAMRGAQASKCVNSDADGNIQSGTVSCKSSDTYYLQARVRAGVGTAELVAYDVTNSAEIESETWDEVGEGTISFTFTTPATCEQIAVRLQGQGASDEHYWDDVILLRQGAKELALPSWITDYSGQVIRVLTGSHENRHDTDIYWSPIEVTPIPDESNPLNAWKINITPGSYGPVWIEALRPYEELSDDSDTTHCDKELLVLMGCWELLDTLINRAPGQEVQAWKMEMSRVERMLKPMLYRRSRPRMIRR